jgi:uncharacterized protein YggU (UPF0235/DUF167 family)
MKITRFALALLLSPLAFAGPAPAPSSPASETLQGEVLEAKTVEPYTYLRVRTAKGDVWAAVPQAPVRPGSKVTIFDPAEMRDFQSRGLNRTFDSIYFGVLGVEAHAPAATGAANQPVVEPVAKAEGRDAKTVAEVVSGRLALRDKSVTVRARVDRVNSNVMGKNWIHLRDGSGTPAEGNYDLVVTSKESPQVGKVVVARGVVRADIDVGAGHAFKVIVEDASFR